MHCSVGTLSCWILQTCSATTNLKSVRDVTVNGWYAFEAWRDTARSTGSSVTAANTCSRESRMGRTSCRRSSRRSALRLRAVLPSRAMVARAPILRRWRGGQADARWSVSCSSQRRVDRSGCDSPAKRRLRWNPGIRRYWRDPFLFGTDERFFHHRAIRFPSEASRPPRAHRTPDQFRYSRRALADLIQSIRHSSAIISATKWLR